MEPFWFFKRRCCYIALASWNSQRSWFCFLSARIEGVGSHYAQSHVTLEFSHPRLLTDNLDSQLAHTLYVLYLVKTRKNYVRPFLLWLFIRLKDCSRKSLIPSSGKWTLTALETGGSFGILVLALFTFTETEK